MCVVVLAAIGAAGAYAATITGTQNPDFRVRVSITPVHPTLGQTIVAHFSIWNMTGHNVNGEWQFTWSTPRTGIGASIAGTLGPGRLAGETIKRTITLELGEGPLRALRRGVRPARQLARKGDRDLPLTANRYPACSRSARSTTGSMRPSESRSSRFSIPAHSRRPDSTSPP